MSIETKAMQVDISKMSLEDIERYIQKYNKANQKMQHLFNNLQELLKADAGLEKDPEVSALHKEMKEHGFSLQEMSVKIFTPKIIEISQQLESTRVILSRVVIMNYLKKINIPGLKYELEEIVCPNHHDDDDEHNHVRMKIYANKKNAVIEDYMNRADWI